MSESKCRICGDEMTVQRICGSHITYGCTGATYDDKGCYYAEGRSIADDHYGQSRVTVIDVSDPEVLALLDEREAQSKRIAELETNLAALAAENARLKVMCEDRRRFIMKGVQLGYIKVPKAETDPDLETIRIAISPQKPIPATDAFLAEVRAGARNEGINYTASRLAAAFNHGFINKTLREVFDVTRMILSAKEELANEPHPIDGLSGEYAEKSLEEWAEQIRASE